MGRDYTPKYRLEIDGAGTPMAWDVRRHGKPTTANLERWVMNYTQSLTPSGVNAHIARALGHIPYPNWARVVLNTPRGEPVAEWHAAAFQVYGDTLTGPARRIGVPSPRRLP